MHDLTALRIGEKSVIYLSATISAASNHQVKMNVISSFRMHVRHLGAVRAVSEYRYIRQETERPCYETKIRLKAIVLHKGRALQIVSHSLIANKAVGGQVPVATKNLIQGC